jgi:hypothetical protein
MFPYLLGIVGGLERIDRTPLNPASFAYIDRHGLIRGPTTRVIRKTREVRVLPTLTRTARCHTVEAADGCAFRIMPPTLKNKKHVTLGA